MMSHSDNSTDSNSNNHSSGNLTDNNTDFGSVLAEARKVKDYTIDEISEYLKIPAHIITALENNDKETLPAPTFAKGYIRAYAKFLEISEDKVLNLYNRAVPHDDVSDLKPRSNLPGETNSQSPLIKTITIVLIVAGIATIGFGSFQYYQEKAGVLESELDNKQQSFTGNSLDSPGENRLNIKQHARLTDNDGSIVEKSDSLENRAEENRAEGTRVKARVEEIRAEKTGKVEVDNLDAGTFAGAIAESAESVETNSEAAQSGAVNENDILEIFAENGSWVEVRDANKSRLLYNMLPAGASKVLVGHAPFSISMGNARTTRVVINDLEIDVTDYIRSNNTASFKVSTEGQNIIFH
ncbi:MAG: helix-turn-helix domain-containing protein [Gammaproteobacteria bacterium]|nr:MAG: helix-turn-helix domain-containing protein [Gammaproteobacteria bacterium]